MEIELTDYFDAFHLVSYLILIILGIAVYYQISKSARLKKLSQLGFDSMLGSNESKKRRLLLIAPVHMQDPILPSEIKVTYNGLLVFWSVSQQIRKYKITCWCFRKCESNSTEPAEKWSQAIHFDNIDSLDKNNCLDTLIKSFLGYLTLATLTRLCYLYMKDLFLNFQIQ